MDTPPPEQMPEHLTAAYTLNGTIGVEHCYLNQSYPPDKPRQFTKAHVEGLMEKVKRGQTGHYGKTDRWLYKALKRFPIQGLEVAIMGSATAWYEAICLAHGAKVTTIEYNKIITDYPSLTVLTVDEFERAPRQFDAALSISSFEHDGLGRYGDPLNPEGDLAAMKHMKEVVRPGGLLFLAVPLGRDKIVWNAHRIYGPRRLPLLLSGWEVVGKFGYNIVLSRWDTGREARYQPVWVLRNT